jgi:hypothetical protein
MSRPISLFLLVIVSAACVIDARAEELIHVASVGELQQALLQARTFEAPVRIELADGVYALSEPLLLTAEDARSDAAPMVIAGLGKTIISGGQELHLSWKAHENGIYKAEVPQRCTAVFDIMFINGIRQDMARYPNAGEYKRGNFFRGTSPRALSPTRTRQWAHPEGAYMHALHEAQWGSKHYEITGVDDSGKVSLRGGWQENRGGGWDEDFRGGYHNEYLFVENIFEELDAPGEWFYDRNDRLLYLMPRTGVDISEATVVAAGLLELIRLEGTAEQPVTNIHIDNIIFKHTKRLFMEPYERLLRGDWSIARLAALRLKGTENCRITHCTFSGLGGNAVFIDGYARGNEVSANHFEDIGESGVVLVGSYDAVRSGAICYDNTLPQDEIDLTPGPKSPDYPKDCLIHNNLMHELGFVGKQTAGVFISMAEEITVSHNTIFRIPRAAICINDGTWGGHIIEFNDAFDTVRESGDHGPFNSWGRDRWWKTSYNGGKDIESFAKERALLDAWKTTHIRNNRFSHPGGHSWGIDLDDGSSNYSVYNNLCLNMGIKFREGYFRRAENNIIINGFFGFHVWLPGCDDVVRNNIVVDADPYRLIRANPQYAKEFNHNLFWNSGSNMVFGDEKLSFAQWQAAGLDTDSLVADPKFIAPEKGNYHVADDSPALQLGFKNFPMNQFGVTKPEFQHMVASIPRTFTPAPTESAAHARSNSTVEWQGMKVKNLVGEGEKSAAGLGEESGVLIVDGQGVLSPGDVILELDGTAIDTVDDLHRLSQEKQGRTVQLRIWRGSARAETLTLM